MKATLIAVALTAGLATQALAATSSTHFAVRDTVGTCSVIDTLPSKSSGLRILGSKKGYSSEADAQKALGAGCTSVINRA